MSGGPNPYDAPATLPREDDTARCEADITLRLTEPNVTNVRDPRGFSWTGVAGISVAIIFGGKTHVTTTSSDGTAKFKAVPCGLHQIGLAQSEFRIEAVDSKSIKVSALRKSGRDFEIRILRKLLTVEMFRLPTSYVDSARGLVSLGPKYTRGDPYGHHWLKIFANADDARAAMPQDSYGWWPAYGAIRSETDTFTGVQGALNGYVAGALSYPGASPTSDPYQDDSGYQRGSKYLEDNFFPYVTNGYSAAEYKRRLRSKAQGFSSAVTDQWNWLPGGGGWHCKTFQAYIMREARVWKRVGVRAWSGGWSAST